VTTIAQVLCAATRRLRAAGIEGARAEARLLLRHVTGLPPEDLVADRDRSLEAGAVSRFEALVARRAAREPMAYVLGEREFWSLPLSVGPGVLVPRPETETLVEAALEAFPDRTAPLRILDLGTGSGCLLLALLREYPNAVGVGVDRSAEALAHAARNARRHGLDGRALLVRGDWGRGLAGPFELIVANPPYVASGELTELAPEVARYEPRAALDGGADGLDAYRAILPDLPRLLAPAGVACLEIGAGQATALAALAEVGGFRVAVRPDLAGIPRCLVLRRGTP
jgi:release factor glutamine methyltransferase